MKLQLQARVEPRFTSAAIGVQELLGVVTDANRIRCRQACRQACRCRNRRVGLLIPLPRRHIANTLIFALAGVITRKAAFGKYIRPIDWAWSVVFYILVVGARAVMMLVFYPVLSKIGYGMKKRRGVLTRAGAAEVEKDLDADRWALKAARRRKRVANVDRHVDLVRGRGGDADTTESQRDMLDLTMTNAWSATTAASTHTRHRGTTDELSEI